MDGVTNTETDESYTGDDAAIVIAWIYSKLVNAETQRAERIKMVTD